VWVKLEEILLFWGGDERGNRFSGPIQDFPFCIPVGSQAPHAAGVAYASGLIGVPGTKGDAGRFNSEAEVFRPNRRL
jgi:hypothetical protein